MTNLKEAVAHAIGMADDGFENAAQAALDAIAANGLAVVPNSLVKDAYAFINDISGWSAQGLPPPYGRQLRLIGQDHAKIIGQAAKGTEQWMKWNGLRP